MTSASTNAASRFRPVRAAMGAGWERVSHGMVETEEGPLLLVDIAALIAGADAKGRGLSSSLPLAFNAASERKREAEHEKLPDRR